ncbi:O-succinylbenzoate-CoA ligase [Oscillochloris trichoides DG-6]|uniref:O-succinylbenzoate-CoA ligase n=1 Tax=Oscillochloris trichoides DG-6 TaxID=765420 RepID=E1IFG7_9CHLR|nr:AMP-binding protein [Oscillochloris trichoides]EFO80077.1 O-succinylbenzoate-CoA ligase [Oscillochloris trichoides DG-6]
MHIPDWLAQRAAAHPARTALISAAGRFSFAELDQCANLLAAQLVALGLQPGERVAVLAHNSAAYVTLIHAAPRCGAALVLLNTRLTASELQFQLNDSGARVLLYDAAHRDLAARLSVPGLGSHGLENLFLPPPNLPPLGGGTPLSTASGTPLPLEGGTRLPAPSGGGLGWGAISPTY